MASLDNLTKNRLRIALELLSRRAHPVAAYLFGSRAEGLADKWSDYDLAVFVEGAEKWDLPSLARFCASIQKEAGDDIELHIFPASQAYSPEPASFAAYILNHGVRLDLEGTTAA
jgi:predicted nucleotidyltransferase